MHEEIVESFEKVGGTQQAKEYSREEINHGRLEHRTAYALEAKDWLSSPVLAEWDHLTTIVKVEFHVEFLNGKYAWKKKLKRNDIISVHYVLMPGNKESLLAIIGV